VFCGIFVDHIHSKNNQDKLLKNDEKITAVTKGKADKKFTVQILLDS
jgi:hypothetical protein